MIKIIAIKGHPLHGHLVIETLKKLGGIGSYCEFPYKSSSVAFYIRESDNKIVCKDIQDLSNEFEIMTLTSFKEKYPFVIGDRVCQKSLKKSPHNIILFIKGFRQGKFNYEYVLDFNGGNLYVGDPDIIEKID